MLTAHINVGKRSIAIKETDSIGPLDEGIRIHNQKRSYSKPVYDPGNPLVFGMGPLTGLGLPGTHRLTFLFRSPLSGGLYVSTMGGAGWHLKRTGIDAVSIEGRADRPTMISIKGEGKDTVFEFFETDLDRLVKLWEQGGARRLTGEFVKELNYPFRAVTVGPAALKTPFGIAYSADLVNNKIRPGSEDVAGKGGAGSIMMQAHNVVGVAFGGKAKPYKVIRGAQKVIEKQHGKDFQQIFRETTEKYSYSPKLKTGGTFGSNYPHLQVYTPMFNFAMIYMSKEERELKWKELMGPMWWEKFNKETIKPKKFATCGEPCPVACKKVYKGQKVDYEPFEACGPNSWIFDLDQATRLVSFVDTMGYDAIEFGGIMSWMLDAVRVGKIPAKDIGFNKDWSYSGLADFGIKLAKDLSLSDSPVIDALRQGKRQGGRILDDLFDGGIQDLATYVPYGKSGYMSPTMYWAIGNFVPLPLQGRYWTYYKFAVWFEPEDLAERSFQRAVAEAELDNLGVCRFHRGWFEPALDKMLKYRKLKSNGEKMIKDIMKYNQRAGAAPTFWDTQRTKDIIKLGARDFGAEEWANKFEQGGDAALMEYWHRFEEALALQE
ncbi:MAG: glyceraldehyde-3-phosphate:ferredoxin oxidoreductase [Candidatus Altiarchaeota archaeon]|nr:glyceraldehyde-3-phosphate:ferredoxin oxidoreductase [Candidatus Altiarchaeota archaeon]